MGDHSVHAPHHTPSQHTPSEPGSAPFTSVHDDEDLWAHILSTLPLTDLYAASSTSRFHRSLLRSSRTHVQRLSIRMERGVPAANSSAGFNDGLQPVIVVEETPRRCEVDRILIPRLPAVSIRKAGSSMHHLHLVQICSCYPKLTWLRIDVSPTPPNSVSPATNLHGVERLIDVVSWMSRSAIQLKTDKRIGPHPWCLLGTPAVETLHLVATFDRRLQTDPKENDETCVRIQPLMLMCIVSCARSLRSLDLSGVGPGVMNTLLSHCAHVLPRLRILRLGAPSSRNGFGWAYERSQLGAIGPAFPGLTALDVGYADFVGGVSYADVDELVTDCKGMEHLDLSGVMTYMDFGPALRILANKAPKLRSLATHGLVLPQHSLLELAAGCPLLERAHFVRWMGDYNHLVPRVDYLEIFRAFSSLVHLDVSGGVAPQAQLLTWLDERQQSGRPVQSLVVHGCYFEDAGGEVAQHTAEVEMAIQQALKVKALAITKSLQVSIGLEQGCEWTQESERAVSEHGAEMSWMRPRQRMFNAIGL